MSMFLPESTTQAAPTTVAINESVADPTSEDVALMQRVFAAAAKNPTLIPDGLLSYVLDWLQVSNLEIPIGQVFGFQKFLSTQVSIYMAVAGGTVSTTNAAITDLGGPTISNLPDGKYIIVWGAQASGNAGVSNAIMGVAVNATSAPATDNSIEALTSSSTFTSVMAADKVTLSNGGTNAVSIQYASSNNVFNCQFQGRYIIAIRYANA